MDDCFFLIRLHGSFWQRRGKQEIPRPIKLNKPTFAVRLYLDSLFPTQFPVCYFIGFQRKRSVLFFLYGTRFPYAICPLSIHANVIVGIYDCPCTFDSCLIVYENCATGKAIKPITCLLIYPPRRASVLPNNIRLSPFYRSKG